MKPISQAWCCQIDITNVCPLSCLYCSRYLPHVRKDQRFFMDLDFFRNALDSLKDWPATIGIIGGEPTVHPQFREFCAEIAKRFPKEKAMLWTSGGRKYEACKDIVVSTFSRIAYNPHTPQQMEHCRHQRITMAIGDVVKDDKLRAELIDDCWVQRTWCPSIGHKGAFFCEVAYALDTLLDGPGGYPVEPGWWKRTPDQFKDQVDRYCNRCGMPVPMERDLIKQGFEYISPDLLDEFRSHNLRGLDGGKIAVLDLTLNREQIDTNKTTWYPGNYRGDVHEDEKAPEGKGSTK